MALKRDPKKVNWVKREKKKKLKENKIKENKDFEKTEK